MAQRMTQPHFPAPAVKHKSPDFRGFVEERMMGLEPTTFCDLRLDLVGGQFFGRHVGPLVM